MTREEAQALSGSLAEAHIGHSLTYGYSPSLNPAHHWSVQVGEVRGGSIIRLNDIAVACGLQLAFRLGHFTFEREDARF